MAEGGTRAVVVCVPRLDARDGAAAEEGRAAAAAAPVRRASEMAGSASGDGATRREPTLRGASDWDLRNELFDYYDGAFYRFGGCCTATWRWRACWFMPIRF